MTQRLNTSDPIQNISVDIIKDAFEESRSPLIITDNRLKDNPIVYSNRAFYDLTGYDADEIIGKNCRFLQGADSDKSEVKSLRTAIDAGKSERVNIKNYRKDGTPFWNDLVISPINDASGETTHFVGMQLDITERILAQEQLTHKQKDLEASNQELEQFTYATSHDLQEPLRMVNSYLQLVKKRYDKELDDKAKLYLDFASEGAGRMQDLINDLLTLSRVTSSDVAYRPYDINEAIERSIHNLSISIEESGAQIDVAKMPSQEIDPVQITQLFQNLISNAIKYRKPNETPQISISVKKKRNEMEYSVTDNGIGIDKKYFDRIFVVFQRLHTRSEYEGTGIGLAISARIVQRHKGKLWVESTLGKGSTFKFTLPLNERAS